MARRRLPQRVTANQVVASTDQGWFTYPPAFRQSCIPYDYTAKAFSAFKHTFARFPRTFIRPRKRLIFSAR